MERLSPHAASPYRWRGSQGVQTSSTYCKTLLACELVLLLSVLLFVVVSSLQVKAVCADTHMRSNDVGIMGDDTSGGLILILCLLLLLVVGGDAPTGDECLVLPLPLVLLVESVCWL